MVTKLHKGIIYKYTFPNGKVYIGQTINPVSRKNSHLNEKTGARNVAFWRAYKKYQTYKYEVIESIEDESREGLCDRLNDLEQKYIAEYQSTNPQYGYNLTSGGRVFVVNEEGRKHMSEARTDKLPVLQYDLNGDFVAEYESTIAAAKAIGSRAGSVWSCCLGIASGKRVKKVQIVKGFTFRFKADYPDVPPHIDLEITSHRTKVLQFSLDGELVKEWDSITEAHLALNCHESGIRQCCNGKYRQCAGFMWRYRDDYTIDPTRIEPVRPKIKREFTQLTIEQIEKGKRICSEKFSKPVLQFSLDGRFVKEFPSLKSAAQEFGSDSGTITNACKQRKIKTAFGFMWRYKEDVVNPIEGIAPFKNASRGRKKPILQFSEDGKLLKEWDCIKAAADFYHVSKGCLSQALSLQRKSVGFYWKYKLYGQQDE